MAKVNRAKELVENHSTEEVLEWLEQALKRGTIAVNPNKYDPAFLLGQCSINLEELYAVVSALREKLNPKAPVVA